MRFGRKTARSAAEPGLEADLCPVCKLVDGQGVAPRAAPAASQIILVPLVDELHVAQVHAQAKGVLLAGGMTAPVVDGKRIVLCMLDGILVACRSQHRDIDECSQLPALCNICSSLPLRCPKKPPTPALPRMEMRCTPHQAATVR